MKKNAPYLYHDVQSAGPQYLEDLATGYWFSEVLFAAVETDIFSRLDPDGASLEKLAVVLEMNPEGLRRFLDALAALGLITNHEERFFNTEISGRCLVRGKKDYQGDSILWRKYLQPCWSGITECLKAGGRVAYDQVDDPEERKTCIRKYIRGMDCIAGTKAGEILRFFEGVPMKGGLLDVGAGSGAVAAAFLEQYPDMKATLLDLPAILEFTKELMRERGVGAGVEYRDCNILERWPVGRKQFALVILSNIIHAHSEKELPHVLAEAAAAVSDDGLLLIHDFFAGHCPEKAALTDLNMFINTFNGRVFRSSLVQQELKSLGFQNILEAPLETDTAVLFASRSAAVIGSLSVGAVDRLLSKVQAIGFRRVYRMKAEEIPVADWTDLKCRFGCERYGSPHCPPHSPDQAKTRSALKDYSSVLLLEGEPPTRDFQMKVLKAEREAFLQGFQKAFSFWSGPCSLCDSCVTDGNCRNTAMARPSMEGAGIDVFETAKRAGASLRPLRSKTEFAKYFGLLLLE